MVKEKDYHHITDQQLLENFYKDHDNKWLGVLLQRYTLLLLGVSMKYLKNEEEAKDCVQQIFEKVILELQKYRVTYFKSWLYMVVKNQCLMRLREKQNKMTIDIPETLPAAPETDKEELWQNELTMELMNESLLELSPEQQQCVTLFYLHKKSYQEISESAGYSLLQVKSYIQNGKRNLRLMIEKKLKEKQSHL
jgi:RNA polymerase sigma factor (sigma-70 family)